MDRRPPTPPEWQLPLPRPLEHPPALREEPAPPADRRSPADIAAGIAVRTTPIGDWPRAEAPAAEPRRRPRAGWAPEPGPPQRPPRAGWPDPPQTPTRTGWRRFVRSRRGAAGLAIVAAALLLWPFAGLSWIPWLIGFVALILFRLLRLDGLLRGWDVHLAGLVVVVGLMVSTTPWAWGLAASIGVLIAGLTRLPAWRLAALGVVACLLAGAGYVWSNIERERAAVAAWAPQQQQSRQDQGAPRPNSVLPIMLNRIAQGSPAAICDNLLAEPAGAQFAAAFGQPDCAAAVRELAGRVSDRRRYADPDDVPSEPAGTGLTVNACALSWGSKSAGPQLGHLTITAIAPERYQVTAFRPC